jgi:hypothetical protein
MMIDVPEEEPREPFGYLLVGSIELAATRQPFTVEFAPPIAVKLDEDGMLDQVWFCRATPLRGDGSSGHRDPGPV